MTTFKSVKVFMEKGITYFGIPEDMIVFFLDQALRSKNEKKFEDRQNIIQKLGLFVAARSEIDTIMADKIEATIIQQIMESKNPITKREQWVISPVKFDKTMNMYRFTNDNLSDLNSRLKLQYKLAWVYKLLSMRHGMITEGFVVIGSWKPREPNTRRRLTSIDIPKNVIDKILKHITTKNQESAVQSLNKPVKPEPGKWKLSQDEQEIVEIILMIVEREEVIDEPLLKGRVERAAGSEVPWDVFLKIVGYMADYGLINLDGNTVKTA